MLIYKGVMRYEEMKMNVSALLTGVYGKRVK